MPRGLGATAVYGHLPDFYDIFGDGGGPRLDFKYIKISWGTNLVRELLTSEDLN